eukprot:6174486-Pleurochrysis_carterae.AAC.2
MQTGRCGTGLLPSNRGPCEMTASKSGQNADYTKQIKLRCLHRPCERLPLVFENPDNRWVLDPISRELRSKVGRHLAHSRASAPQEKEHLQG